VAIDAPSLGKLCAKKLGDYKVFHEIIFTSDIDIVSEYQLMFNFKLPSEQLAQRKDDFISRLHCV